MDTSDYGSLSKPPSDLASTILSGMTEEEKSNFQGLLGRLEGGLESGTIDLAFCFTPKRAQPCGERGWGPAILRCNLDPSVCFNASYAGVAVW
jgi:hypothetical protein